MLMTTESKTRPGEGGVRVGGSRAGYDKSRIDESKIDGSRFDGDEDGDDEFEKKVQKLLNLKNCLKRR